MKFDVMLSNPPFQLGKNSNFYREFIAGSKDLVKEDGHMVFVTPNRYCMNKSKTTNLLNQFQLHYVKWNVSDHFPKVGTFIGAYVADNHPEPDNTSVSVDFDGFTEDIDFTIENLPPTPIDNKLLISIIQKYFAYPNKCEIVSKRSDDTVFICRQWASRVSDETVGGLVFNTKNETSTDGKIYRVGNPDNFKWFVTHSLFMRFISRCFGSGMFVAPQVASTIPDIGYETPRTDEEVYKEFQLSDEEVEYLNCVMYK